MKPEKTSLVQWTLGVLAGVAAGAILHAVFVGFPNQRAEKDRLERYSVVIHADLEALIGHKEDLNEYIELAKSILLEVTPSRQPNVFARLNLRLAIAQYYLADIEDSEDNCRRSLAVLEDLLQAESAGDESVFLGRINLFAGSASFCLARVRNQGDHISKAIDYLSQARKILEGTDARRDLAKSHYFLGSSYRLQGENRATAENFDLAEASFKESLAVYSGTQDRINQARVLHALGNLYRIRSELAQSRAYLDKAIDAYEDAIAITPIEAMPRDYALFNNSLGVAHYAYAEFFREPESMRSHLAASQEAHRRALLVRSKEPESVEFATTMLNLGNTLDTLASLLRAEAKAKVLQESIQAYRKAADVFQVEAEPIKFAMVQNNIGIALARLFDEDGNPKHLEASLTAFGDALLVRTREQYPLNYARTIGNQAKAYRMLASAGEACKNLAEARNLFQEAIAVTRTESHNAAGDLAFFESELEGVFADLRDQECDNSIPTKGFAKSD